MSGPGSIKSRNRESAIEAQTLLWRALCDGKPKSMRKYITEDAVFVETDNKVYSTTTDPKLSKYIEMYEPWTAYRLQGEVEFVEIDMMSSSLTYRVTAWKEINGEMVGTDALCTGVWRQNAGGDWQCCVHHMTKI